MSRNFNLTVFQIDSKRLFYLSMMLFLDYRNKDSYKIKDKIKLSKSHYFQFEIENLMEMSGNDIRFKMILAGYIFCFWYFLNIWEETFLRLIFLHFGKGIKCHTFYMCIKHLTLYSKRNLTQQHLQKKWNIQFTFKSGMAITNITSGFDCLWNIKHLQ
jgi:hypothetical protein